MAEENKHIQHVKSNVVNNGKPKLPTPDALMPGEIAVNYAKGYETLSIKNSENEITTFSSDNALAFTKLTNPSDSSKVGLVNSLSEYYDTNIGKGAVIEGDGRKVVEEEEEVIYYITASGPSSHAEGYGTTASGYASHAEGINTTASNSRSHAEGDETTASGPSSHAEGSYTTASGYDSHAEGSYTTASGYHSHAEGSYTTASGYHSHAEGSYTTASGYHSHAEGSYTTASGLHSHAEGSFTIANNDVEHASGAYNVSSKSSTTFGDSGNTLFSVGNGNTQNRHNAFEIRQNGDIYIVKDNNDVKLQDVLDENERVVAEALNDLESRKVDKVEGKGLSTNDFKVIELTDYLTQGAVLPTDDNLIYTYSGQVAEKRIGHNGGGDDIIAFATLRDVDGYNTNNINVIKYAKGDEDESYHCIGAFNLRNDSGAVVEELKSMFGVHNATIDTNGLMSKDDKKTLDTIDAHININDSDNTLEINNGSNNINLNTDGNINIGNGDTNKVEINAGSGSVGISSYQADIKLSTATNGDIRLEVPLTNDAIVLSVGNTELRLDETNLLKLKTLLQNS